VTTLSQRDWSITVGTVRVTPGAPGRSLTCRFEVVKTVEREPNKLTLKIYNLTERRRNALLELEEAPQVQVVAGYQDLTDTIFVGDARDIGNYRDGVDNILELEAEDGGTSYRTATIQESFAPGVSVATVIGACADAMGVGRGNTASVAADAELDSGSNTYPTGTTVSGVAWRQLNRVCQSASLRWSVQNGVLQLMRLRRIPVSYRARATEAEDDTELDFVKTGGGYAVIQPAEVRAIRLSPSTGLLGSPTRGKRDDRTGRVTFGAKALMIPGLYPGRVVRLDSRLVESNLLCRRARYVGDTTGNDWMVDLELQEYDT